MRGRAMLLAVVAVACSSCVPLARAATGDVVVGVMLPLHGPQQPLAAEELNGIQAAVDIVNRRGGVQGRAVRVATRDVTAREQVDDAVASLQQAGVSVILGTYSSSLSVVAAHSTSAAGLVYWETGAVADQVTGDGLPRVFRVGAAGSNLGRQSSVFAAEELAHRLGKSVQDVHVTVVEEHDAYGDSVAGAAIQEARRRGMQVSTPIYYNANSPDWNAVFGQLEQHTTDILMLSSYIADGIEFRRAMLARGIRVGAMIGTTMAQCLPDFGDALGPDAVGVFASDRPGPWFNSDTLTGPGRDAYEALDSAYHSQFGREPSEEAISGFSSAWALMADAMQSAMRLDPDGIAAAARAEDLPMGSLPNGAGLKFSLNQVDLGQNVRASAVIWQWQGVKRSVTVWPPVLATGHVEMVPLPR